MKLRKAEFTHCAVQSADYPTDGLPEIALIGRSNVGKSSLINTITGRKKLARTSSVPGKTRTINFYRMNDAFYLVDLPGYGYARAPRGEKKSWREFTEAYLKGRDNLAGVLIILDVRREADSREKELLKWLDSIELPGRIILTKSDKLSANKLQKSRAALKKSFAGTTADAPMIAFSALSGKGKAEVLRALAELAFDGVED